MLIPFGILSAAGSGSDYELIETQILGTAAASVIFSGLGAYANAYKHLQVRAVIRSVRAAADDQITLRLNGDTGSNYAWHRLLGNGSAVSSTGATSTATPQLGSVPANTATASMFGALVVDLLDPYSTTKNKTVRSFNGFAGSWVALHSVFHNSTSAISSIELIGQNANIAIGSRFSLYGIR
jgi:hypothetical protein